MNKYHQYIQSKQWRSKCKFIKSVTCGRDAIFPFLKASHVHHLTYRNLEHELFLRDVIPLHPITHSLIHGICRLGVRRHDIIPIRTALNWLILRPLACLWLLPILALAVLFALAKIGNKIKQSLLG